MAEYPTHIEKIRCPECGEIQDAEVEHTPIFDSYVHKCRKCGYWILESEWEREPNADTIVARLTPDWGGRLALLFKQDGIYYEDGEEIPYGAIEDWQEVTL